MPELPEVETIKRGLKPLIVDKFIQKVEVLELGSTLFRGHEGNIKSKVKSVSRRGKVLIWNLANGYSLLFHLKMTGQIVVDGVKQEKEIRNKEYEKRRFAGGHPTGSMAGELPDNSTRVVFTLDDGSLVYFNDQRKFGWVKLVESSKVESEKFISTLGPDALNLKTKSWELEVVPAINKSTRAIKNVLLDQKVLAGIGNIYADEALFVTKIHPKQPANSLGRQEIQRLKIAIHKVLQDGINRGGTSFTNYVNVLGTRGDYLENSWVFRRNGEPCRVCGAKIKKIKLAGRSTHLCPKCQKLI